MKKSVIVLGCPKSMTTKTTEDIAMFYGVPLYGPRSHEPFNNRDEPPAVPLPHFALEWTDEQLAASISIFKKYRGGWVIKDVVHPFMMSHLVSTPPISEWFKAVCITRNTNELREKYGGVFRGHPYHVPTQAFVERIYDALTSVSQCVLSYEAMVSDEKYLARQLTRFIGDL